MGTIASPNFPICITPLDHSNYDTIALRNAPLCITHYAMHQYIALRMVPLHYALRKLLMDQGTMPLRIHCFCT